MTAGISRKVKNSAEIGFFGLTRRSRCYVSDSRMNDTIQSHAHCHWAIELVLRWSAKTREPPLEYRMPTCSIQDASRASSSQSSSRARASPDPPSSSLFLWLKIRQDSSWSLLSGSAPWNDESLERQILTRDPRRTGQMLGSFWTMVKTCVENKACAVLEFGVALACRWIKTWLF